MAITQLSVFIENRAGRLQRVLSMLSNNGINIRALSLADTSDYGILRLIVDKQADAFRIMKEESFSVSATPVIAAEVEDTPGGLLRIIDILVAESINIEYLYAFVEKAQDKAVVVLRVEEVEKAERILEKKSVKILKADDVLLF